MRLTRPEGFDRSRQGCFSRFIIFEIFIYIVFTGRLQYAHQQL